MVEDVLRSLSPKDNDGDQVCHDAKERDAKDDRPIDPIGKAEMNILNNSHDSRDMPFKSTLYQGQYWTHNPKVVGLNIKSSNILDGNGVKDMPGLIPAPNSDSL